MPAATREPEDMTVLYQEYFGLKEPPFSIAPDPRYLFMSEQHREALAHLSFGISSYGGFILLTGDVGTGKTTVSRCLLEQIPSDTHIAFALNPRLSVEELLAVICDELGIEYPEGTTSNKIFIDRINAFLLSASAKGHKTVLIIEEAQNLSPDVLEQVRLLTNLETNQCKLLQIILLGQPELRDMLSRPEMSQLEQRITARFHLGPLSKKDLGAYVSHRLAIAGVHRQLFPATLMPVLYRLSSGVPRLVNLICDRSLLGAYVQGKDRVDRATLKKAAEEALGRKERGVQRLNIVRWISAGIVMLVAGAAIAVLPYQNIFRRPLATELKAEEKTEALHLSTDSLKWPVDQSTEKGRDMAFQALFKKRGVIYKSMGKDDACIQASKHGLQCLTGLSDLQRLIRLNRPSVLKLYNNNAGSFYVMLNAVEGQSAEISIADRYVNVNLKEIEKKWHGEYTLFWNPPPFWRGEIRPGAAGTHIAWLAELMEKRTGDSRFGLKRVYDDEMAREIRKFQIEEGLIPDGIVGVQTVIHLQSRFDVGEPLLKKGSKGI